MLRNMTQCPDVKHIVDSSGILVVITNAVAGVIDFGAGIITGVRCSVFREAAASWPLTAEIDVTHPIYYRQGALGSTQIMFHLAQLISRSQRSLTLPQMTCRLSFTVLLILRF